MQSWRPRTRSQYASRLRASWRLTRTARARLIQPQHWQASWRSGRKPALQRQPCGVLLPRSEPWRTSSGCPPTVTTLHKRIAAGAASSGSQPYLSPAGLVQLVEKARDSRHGAVFSALAIISWVCYLRVGEAAGIRVTDLAMPGFVQFWNSKTGEEGYTTRPLYRYADGVRAWLHGHMVSLGRSSDMLVWQSGEAGLEAGMADALASTAHFRARWHALRRGGAAATWARKPDLAYYKWWGRWQSTAVAMQYGTKWSDPGVVAPTVLPAWSRDLGPLPTPERVGVLALWGSPMFPSIASALNTPTKRKQRLPRGQKLESTASGTLGGRRRRRPNRDRAGGIPRGRLC